MLLELRSREQWVIFPNTNSGYGTRSGDALCTEETPLEPISVYGRTKVEAEADVLDSPNAITLDRKSTRLNSSHSRASRMPSSA